MIITRKLLNKIFKYENGYLIWKITTGGRRIGSIAGHLSDDRYIRIRCLGKLYLAHRLVFLMHHGYLPKYLDHINRDRTDNRIENLREATSFQNNRNSSLPKTNTSGFKGVCRSGKKWRARIAINKKLVCLGTFSTKKEAALRYNEEALKVSKKFAFINMLDKNAKSVIIDNLESKN